MTYPAIQPLEESPSSPVASPSLASRLALEGGPSGPVDASAFTESMRRAESTLPLNIPAHSVLTHTPTGEVAVGEAAKTLTKLDLPSFNQRPLTATSVSEPPLATLRPADAEFNELVQPRGPEEPGMGPNSLKENLSLFDLALDRAEAPIARSTSRAAPIPHGPETIITALQEAGGKIDVDALRNDGSRLMAEFSERQNGAREQLLQRVASDPSPLKKSDIWLLNKRMGEVQGYQETLANLTGVRLPDKTEPPKIPFAGGSDEVSLARPFSTFFGFITNGEDQLHSIERELAAFSGPGAETLSPVAMLQIQVKMSHISQQLELFTSMLNKGLESSKTVLNTQI